MTALDLLQVPRSARLVAHDQAGDTALNWEEIRAAAATRCKTMPSANSPSSVFGICAENGLETLLTIFAVVAASGIPAPLPPETDAGVVSGCMDRLGAAGLWTGPGHWTSRENHRTQPAGFEMVMHSSGSTGLPKPLAIRLEAMRRNALDVAQALGLHPGDVHAGTFSQCYMSGLYNATILPLVTGATSVSLAKTTPLTVAQLLDAVERHRVSVLWLSPLVANMLATLRGVTRNHLRRLRVAVSCTAPLPESTKAAFEDKFSVPLLQSYGLSETLITTLESVESPAPGGVGRPIGRTGAVHLDRNGQIVVSNGAHFAGYLDGPIGPAVSPVDPFETGDLGRFDERGNLYVVGRLSEVINRDGVKFAPAVVEAAITRLPGVIDCCVLGVDDPDRGTRIIAFVHGDGIVADDLLGALQGRLQPIYQPHEIRVVDEMPRTSAGKISRPDLQRRL